MRNLILLTTIGAVLLVPASAGAATQTASAGGVTATLSYTGGPGITTKNLRLSISQNGKVVYNQPVVSKACFKTCSPTPKGAVHVVYLEGTGALEVVVSMFTNGADCCGIEQVFTPSASMGTYYKAEHNFGPVGARLEQLTHDGHYELVSGDPFFYCQFSACFASGLPIQIWGWNAGSFIDLTRRFPALIAKDAAVWWSDYRKHLKQGTGLIAAWAADEDLLGKQATVASTLATEVRAHHISASFVSGLQHFLKTHGYA